MVEEESTGQNFATHAHKKKNTQLPKKNDREWSRVGQHLEKRRRERFKIGAKKSKGRGKRRASSRRWLQFPATEKVKSNQNEAL